jgi:hypothetical protein
VILQHCTKIASAKQNPSPSREPKGRPIRHGLRWRGRLP